MRVKIETIYINETKADGSPMINQKGEPFKMCNLKFNGKQASMYIGKFKGVWDKKLDVVSQWRAGDEVDIILEESGQYLNFKLPTKSDVEIEKIKFRLDRIEGKLGLSSVERQNTPLPPQNTLKNDLNTPGEASKLAVEAQSPVSVDEIPFK